MLRIGLVIFMHCHNYNVIRRIQKWAMNNSYIMYDYFYIYIYKNKQLYVVRVWIKVIKLRKEIDVFNKKY